MEKVFLTSFNVSKWTNYIFDRLISLFIFVFFFLVVVVPNSFRFITIPLFLFLGFISLFSMRLFNRRLTSLWLMGSCVTIFYILIGLPNSYPAAVPQVIFVYIVAPFIWMLILSFVFSKYNLQFIFKTFFSFSFIGAISVPLFLIIFLLYGPHALNWLIKEPNAVFTSGSAGVTMHVLGPLSFVVAGFFSTPKIIKNLFLRFIISFVFIIAVIISGRAALFVSFFVGIFFNILFGMHKRCFNFFSFIYYLISGGILLFCSYLLSTIFNFNILMVVHNYISKILEMGGQERILQANALIQGICSNLFLGSGHGVGVGVIRNSEFPWRYELLYLATLYRVGLIGFIVYSLPSLFVIRGYLKVSKNKSHSWLRLVDRYMFVGFIATIIISATNPYLESFEFQWMFWCPVVYFILRQEVHKLNGINFNSNS